jgi:hypothetical protein
MGTFIALRPLKIGPEDTRAVGDEIPEAAEWTNVDNYILCGDLYYRPEADEPYDGAWPNTPLGGVGHPTVASKILDLPAEVAEAYDLNVLVKEELAPPNPEDLEPDQPPVEEDAPEIELSTPTTPSSGSGKTPTKKVANKS